MVLQSLCWGGLCVTWWSFQSLEQRCRGLGCAKESCEGLLRSENEELLIWRGGKCDQTVNRVRINLWEIVKTRRGRGGGTRKEKKERKKCPLILYLKSWKLQPSVECGSEHLPSQCSGDWGIFGGQSQLHNEILPQDNKTEQKWAWWHMSIITALGQWRQEDQEFKARKLRPAKSVWDSASKINKWINKT